MFCEVPYSLFLCKESVTCKLPDHIKEDTEYIFDKNIEKYKDQVNARMEEYASYEIEKYESWSDDKLVPLQKEIIVIFFPFYKENLGMYFPCKKER